MGIIRQSFKRQIFFVFLLTTLVLVIGGGALAVNAFQARIVADYEKRDEEQEQVICDKLNNVLDLSNEAIDNIEANQVLKDSFTLSRGSRQEIYSALYQETEGVRDFAIVDLYSDGKCLFSTRSGDTSDPLPENYAVLREATSNNKTTVYALNPDNATEEGATLLIARQVVNGFSKGVVVIRIEQSTVQELLRDGMNAKDGFMLTNRYLRPFCQLGTAEDGAILATIRRNLMSGQLYNKDIETNVYMSELGDTGLLSIYVTPQPLDAGSVKTGYRVVIIIGIISVIVCLLISNRLSEYFYRPIKALSFAMKRFRKGDFDTKIEIDREDEFQELATGFNKMTTQLSNTMEERVAAERKTTETRIAMMQAQLNPHFLYNTLDTIKWVAKANQVPEVATLSASLAGILRSSISEKQFCPLSKELQLVENYIEIQRIRFENSFTLNIDVPNELMDAIIPKLILQPLVENAIIHGFKEQDEGKVEIFASKTEDKDLLISIKDNGEGISDEMINILETKDTQSLTGHIGLNNVNTIIELYYGPEYGVKAERLQEGGTIMTVRLPFSKEEPNND